MKIKVKDKNNINTKLTHQELVIIREALLYYYDISKDIDIFNQILYDEDEFFNLGELKNKIWKMINNSNDSIYLIRKYFK